MPTGSIIVLILMAVAIAAIYVWWSRSNHRAPAPGPHSQPQPETKRSPEPELQTEPSPSPSVARSEGSIPDVSSTTLERESDSDPEITMMGKVPDEVLAALRGTLHADGPVVEEEEEEEPSVDIDVQELVDETEEEETTGKHALILVVGVARSDRGRHRRCNEDAFLVLEDHHLFVVADGMGGHNAGEIASQASVDIMQECFEHKHFPGEPRPEWPRRGDELVRSIHHANRRVFELSANKPEYAGMGTTVVAVRFSPNKQRAYIAHVGDSRCYRIRGGELHQLTEDHTLGRLMGAKGKAAKHLAQAVGVRSDVAVDLTVDEPQPGDLYLVCSDGLTKMVPDDVILDVALADGDLEARSKALIAAANEKGGRDNITVIIIQVEKPIHEAQRVSDRVAAEQL
ncbi:MAG: protein phosphatase 2C domain-containing protein [Myxococcota bacterium]